MRASPVEPGTEEMVEPPPSEGVSRQLLEMQTNQHQMRENFETWWRETRDELAQVKSWVSGKIDDKLGGLAQRLDDILGWLRLNEEKMQRLEVKTDSHDQEIGVLVSQNVQNDRSRSLFSRDQEEKDHDFQNRISALEAEMRSLPSHFARQSPHCDCPQGCGAIIRNLMERVAAWETNVQAFGIPHEWVERVGFLEQRMATLTPPVGFSHRLETLERQNADLVEKMAQIPRPPVGWQEFCERMACMERSLGCLGHPQEILQRLQNLEVAGRDLTDHGRQVNVIFQRLEMMNRSMEALYKQFDHLKT